MAWANPFGGATGTQFDFWNDGDEGSRQAYDMYLGSLGLTSNARRYAKGLFGDAIRGHGNYALGLPDPTSSYFTDWLSGGGAQTLIDQYNNLGASERGFNMGRYNSGRKMW
jgi:hypothetical protein